MQGGDITVREGTLLPQSFTRTCPPPTTGVDEGLKERMKGNPHDGRNETYRGDGPG